MLKIVNVETVDICWFENGQHPMRKRVPETVQHWPAEAFSPGTAAEMIPASFPGRLGVAEQHGYL